MEIPEFEYLSITGDISVEPVTTHIPRHPSPYLYLIMGPTGAGKSSFIEAFAGQSQKLSISKDQLAGYTQTVTAYQLVNVVHKGRNSSHPVYLVDTPGFSDSKISEIEILHMLRQWAQDNSVLHFERILYLTPITDTRLPGSRRRTFAMLKKLHEDYWALYSTSLVVITTMWDTVHNERTQSRADSNFAQLRDENLREFVRSPSTDIIKFLNTRNSALLAINQSVTASSTFYDYTTSTSPLLYQDLHERIQGTLQEKENIELDLVQPEVQTDSNLLAILERNQRENRKTLTKFIGQLANFGPLPPGFHQADQDLRRRITANITLTDPLTRDIFEPRTQELDVNQEPDVGLKAEATSSAQPLPPLRTSRKLFLKGLLRRLLNTAKKEGAKWFRAKD